jgi:hypothetical protein
VTGNQNEIAYAYFGGVTTLDTSIVNGSGNNNYGLSAYSAINPLRSTINVLDSTVTSAGSGSSAAFVGNGSVLNIVGSTIHGDFNGIVITDDSNTLGRNTVALTSSTLTNLAGGNGEAAFKVEGADVNIAVTNSTVNSGVGATQHTLLDVTQTEQVQTLQVAQRAPPPVVNVPPAGTPTPRVADHSSVVDLTAGNSILNGDILVDAESTANVVLGHNSILTGAVNENQLTGAKWY